MEKLGSCLKKDRVYARARHNGERTDKVGSPSKDGQTDRWAHLSAHTTPRATKGLRGMRRRLLLLSTMRTTTTTSLLLLLSSYYTSSVCMGRIINEAVMGFWDTAKRKAQQTALQGQILLVDRQLTALSHQLGVDIFRLVYSFETAAAAQDSATTTTTTTTTESSSSSHHSDWTECIQGFPAIFQAAREDVQEFVTRRAAADTAADALEARHEAGDTSWMSASAGRAKLAAEMAYLDREILLRQQIFGHQVVDECQLATRDLSTVTEKNEFITLLHKFQADAAALRRTRQEYTDQIAILGGHRPTENQSLVVPDDEGSAVAHADHSESNSTSMTDEYL